LLSLAVTVAARLLYLLRTCRNPSKKICGANKRANRFATVRSCWAKRETGYLFFSIPGVGLFELFFIFQYSAPDGASVACNLQLTRRSASPDCWHMKKLITVITFAWACQAGWAAIRTETIDYKQGDTTLEGFLAYDTAQPNARPGVLIVHQWKGITDYEKKRAALIAELGYTVLVADIYGKGVRADNPKDAAVLAGKYKSDRALLRARVQAALETLRKNPHVNPTSMAAIGYCFGGTTVLELARSGADVQGVVSFHGGLSTPTPAEAKKVRAKVLALHGADDPFVPPAEVAAFEKEMRDAGVDWQLVSYGGAVHSFTDWNAGNDNSKGAAYNEKADQRSWEAMKAFFAETLR
jgi:dienelactone hydrolase